MAYDETLAARIRAVLPADAAISEKKMFGGLCFLRAGAMFCGIAGDDLMVRVGPAGYQAALDRPQVRVMDFTGRPMTGYVFVAPGGTRTRAQVATWIETALAFVATLPPRRPAKKRRPISARRAATAAPSSRRR